MPGGLGSLHARRSPEGTLLERLRRIDSTSLADADKSLRILPLAIRPIATGRRLLGRAVTADARGDLMSVIAALQHAGAGDVLVVSAGSDEHAVAGELFATEALRRGLAGIVIDGRCRDSRTLAEIDLPVYARGVAPSAFPARSDPGHPGPADHRRCRGPAGRHPAR